VTPNQTGPNASPVPPQAQAQMQMLQRQSMASMQPVLPTPTKKWYGTSQQHVRAMGSNADDGDWADHLADRLLGDDPCEFLCRLLSASLTSCDSSSNADKVCVGLRRVFPA
jgi:hypothetical protein